MRRPWHRGPALLVIATPLLLSLALWLIVRLTWTSAQRVGRTPGAWPRRTPRTGESD